ncbi:MAG: hypothetical protein AABM66_14265 [Actinomycetota bacterium]
MQTIREAIVAVLAQDHPMTVRQVFYQLTAGGVIAKTEAEYNGTVCRLLGEMRRSGEIPYEWLADATRWMRKPTTYSSIESALHHVDQHQLGILKKAELEERRGLERIAATLNGSGEGTS